MCTLALEQKPDGDVALAWLKERTDEQLDAIRVIMLDLKLPWVDGRQRLELLKEDPRLAPIPVVMMTTSASPGDVRDAYEAGANSYLVKAEGLVEMVDQMRCVGAYWGRHNRRPSGSAAGKPGGPLAPFSAVWAPAGALAKEQRAGQQAKRHRVSGGVCGGRSRI